MSTFPKKYNHSFEQELYDFWHQEGCFTPEQVKKLKGKASKSIFMISMPPPNVTGVLHLGHALMLAVEDTMVRHARMEGKTTLRVPGTDHAGISTQVVVERKLMTEKKKSKYDLGREKFLDEVWKWVSQSRSTITTQTKYMGASCDWSREQFTMSEKLSRSVRKAFKNLYDKERIYQSTYMVNWSPGAQTVVSDLEVEFKEEEGKLYYLRYFIEGKGDSITIATTRPETIFADVAVAVHPKDRRYKKFIGRNVLIPIVNRPIPVIADDQVAIDFGTGALKITPTHDETDFEIGRRFELPMDRYALDKQNNFTEWAGEELEGKNAYEFFDNLIQYLEEIGNLEKIEPHTHSVPYCERTKERIQPLLSQQWFMDVQPAALRIMEEFGKENVSVYPDRFVKTFQNWLGEIKPRCISRQLWWGHRIPVWYDDKDQHHVFDEDTVLERKSGKYSILSLIIFNLIADSRLTNPFTLEDLLELLMRDALTPQDGKIYQVYADVYKKKFAGIKSRKTEIEQLEEIFGSLDLKRSSSIVAKAGAIIDVLDKSCNISKAGDKYKFDYYVDGKIAKLRQDEDVLDTWFSSGLWPFSILGRPEETPDLKKYYPNTVMETGYDIIFFRVIRMMIMGIEQMGQLPFDHVYLHGLVRDEYGKKMSKSLGNGIDPIKLIEQYGADPLRGALLLGNTPGNDQKFTVKKVDYVWRFINKLWNATRFVVTKIVGDSKLELDFEKLGKDIVKNKRKCNEYDAWMIGRINETIGSTNKYMNKFMLGEALQEIIDLVWHDFCDWYIEIAKIEKSGQTEKIMMYALGAFLKLLHPFMPFVTEKLWGLLGFQGILAVQDRPEELEVGDKNYRINMLMEMISQWRTLKQQVTDKPHEQVSLFVQANKDIQQLVEDHFDLVRDIVKVADIQYFNEHDEVTDEYQIAMLMDIKLGVKGIKEIDWRQTLSDLEKQVAEEEQFLQRMRNMFSGDFAQKAPPKVVKEKKKKMEEVKLKIAKMQFEIDKIKMERA